MISQSLFPISLGGNKLAALSCQGTHSFRSNPELLVLFG